MFPTFLGSSSGDVTLQLPLVQPYKGLGQNGVIGHLTLPLVVMYRTGGRDPAMVSDVEGLVTAIALRPEPPTSVVVS